VKENAVALDHCLSQLEAFVGQADLAPPVALDVTLLLHALDNIGDCRRCDMHPLGQPRANHGLAPRGEIVDDLQIFAHLLGRPLLTVSPPHARMLARPCHRLCPNPW
jgi:hypothetical protein